ncbi:hypothetical protein Gotri_005470 [Gossypium trilobum]|uniref:Uncharacterized protein n=1 Tax=Gossypium trilobum TaxID=34281 RepID=A0A7J9EWN3_9ROSI|nr:hypothetical protein [Gossypium trilobum]
MESIERENKEGRGGDRQLENSRNSSNPGSNNNRKIEDVEYFDLLEKDIVRSSINGIPAIYFSERINQILIKDIEHTMVIKLLGRNIGYAALQKKIGFMLGAMDCLWPISYSATIRYGFQPLATLPECGYGMDSSPRPVGTYVQKEDPMGNRGNDRHTQDIFPKSKNEHIKVGGEVAMEDGSTRKEPVLDNGRPLASVYGPWILVEKGITIGQKEEGSVAAILGRRRRATQDFSLWKPEIVKQDMRRLGQIQRFSWAKREWSLWVKGRNSSDERLNRYNGLHGAIGGSLEGKAQHDSSRDFRPQF